MFVWCFGLIFRRLGLFCFRLVVLFYGFCCTGFDFLILRWFSILDFGFWFGLFSCGFICRKWVLWGWYKTKICGFLEILGELVKLCILLNFESFGGWVFCWVLGVWIFCWNLGIFAKFWVFRRIFSYFGCFYLILYLLLGLILY